MLLIEQHDQLVFYITFAQQSEIKREAIVHNHLSFTKDVEIILEVIKEAQVF